ncbi:molybdopterin molybdotransferase MoeA [soil metagenome]
MSSATAVSPTDLLSLEAALARILDRVEPLPAERVPLAESHGRVLSEALVSRLTLPPWDNSAMDGFAVRAADVQAACDRAVTLRVVGEVAAGQQPSDTLHGGTAIRILTGAVVPPGADAVVPVEDTDAEAGMADLPAAVAVSRPVEIGAYIRRSGSDLRAGDALMPAGVAMGAARLAVAAAGGHGHVTVHRRPRVAVIATGDELVPPGVEPGPAQIPNSNSVALVAQAREAGAEARDVGIAADDGDAVDSLLQAAASWADVIVVSGGVSVGAHDVVKEAFSRLGRMELWRVAVQPGKPLAFARARARQGVSGAGVLLFGLPGNPVSSFVTFELFVRPVLRRMCGHADLSGRETVRAELAEPVTKSAGRRAFLRARLERSDASRTGWLARLAGSQGSHVLSALVAADGLAIIPEDVIGQPAGSEVDVLRLSPGGSA